MNIDLLNIPTRAKNLLAEEEVTKISQFRDYAKPFASINGVGEKLNERLSKLRRKLRAIKKSDEIRDHLTSDGKKQYVLQGGSIDDMDHHYLKRINKEETKEINDIIEAGETPRELVQSVIVWLLTKLNRVAGDELEANMAELALLQDRSHPLILVDQELKNLGFPYVYKKQDEFEESIDYKHVIKELREYLSNQMKNLVFPVMDNKIMAEEEIEGIVEKIDINKEKNDN